LFISLRNFDVKKEFLCVLPRIYNCKDTGFFDIVAILQQFFVFLQCKFNVINIIKILKNIKLIIKK